MYQSDLDHLSLFCGTTGTPGKPPTTTSRDTATSGSKVSSFSLAYKIFCLHTEDEQRWHFSFALLTEEKKGSLQDMANQRGVACRAQGWKIHLCAAQLRQLVSADPRPAKTQLCCSFFLIYD